MKNLRKIKGCLYLQGEYQMKDIKSNYAYPCEFPTILTAYGAGIKSGNWRSCTAINTPDSIHKFYSENIAPIQSNYDIALIGLNETEKFEFFGLVNSISMMAEAYSVVRFGNHGTHEGKNIKNEKCAKVIFAAIQPMVERANELMKKLPLV